MVNNKISFNDVYKNGNSQQNSQQKNTEKSNPLRDRENIAGGPSFNNPILDNQKGTKKKINI